MSIAITDFTANWQFQRKAGSNIGLDGGNADILLSGTWATTKPNSMTATITGGSTYVLSSFSTTGSSSGTWQGTALAVTAADGIKVTNIVDDHSQTASQTNTWGIGKCRLKIGDSIAQWQTTQTYNQGTITPAAHTYITNGNGYYSPAHELNGSNLSAGQAYVPALAMNAERAAMLAINGSSTVSVTEICASLGGTSITRWMTGGDAWIQMLAILAIVGTDFEEVHFVVGANDCLPGVDPTPYYAGDLNNLVTQLYTLTGRDATTLKIGFGAICSCPDGGNLGNTGDASTDFVRKCLIAKAATAGCFYLGSQYELSHNPLTNGIYGEYHFGLPGASELVMRAVRGTLNAYGVAGYTGGALGPVITGASMAVGSNDIVVAVQQNGGTTLVDGTGSSAGTGLVGWYIVINSSHISVSSTAIVGGKIKLTMPSPRASTSDVITLAYMPGHNSVGWSPLPATESYDHVVYDDQTVITRGLPLQETPGGFATPITVANSYSPVIAETSTAQDATASQAVLGAAIAETSTSTDGPNGATRMAVGIGETSTLADTVANGVIWPVVIGETSNLTDAPISAAPTDAVETSTLTDTVASQGSLVAASAEFSTISDTVHATVIHIRTPLLSRPELRAKMESPLE